MRWVFTLELQVNKPPGQLDQAFVETIVGRLATFLQPEMLEHIVSFVIAPLIETLEIAEVTGVAV